MTEKKQNQTIPTPVKWEPRRFDKEKTAERKTGDKRTDQRIENRKPEEGKTVFQKLDDTTLEDIAREKEQQEQQEKQQQKQQKAYEKYVKQVTPTHNLPLQMMKAFVTGGIICCMGQFILNYSQTLGLDKQTAGSWCSLILVLISVILTGFGIYPKIVKWGGAGALVPITGFANGVAAPAIEYKTEGQVFGIGCKIFTIAGPVILYGIFSSWLLGLIYWICSKM